MSSSIKVFWLRLAIFVVALAVAACIGRYVVGWEEFFAFSETPSWFLSGFVVLLISALITEPYYTTAASFLISSSAILITSLSYKNILLPGRSIWNIVALGLIISTVLLSSLKKSSNKRSLNLYKRINSTIEKLKLGYLLPVGFMMYLATPQYGEIALWIILPFTLVVILTPWHKLIKQDGEPVNFEILEEFGSKFALVTSDTLKVGSVHKPESSSGEIEYKLITKLSEEMDGNYFYAVKIKTKSNAEDIIGFVLPKSNERLIRIHMFESGNQVGEPISVKLKDGDGESVYYYQITHIVSEDEWKHNNDKQLKMPVEIVEAYQIGKQCFNSKKGQDEFLFTQQSPATYSPVKVAKIKQKEAGKTQIYIGKLVGKDKSSNFRIPVDPSKIITHSTAITGITGVGKTTIVFELIEGLLKHDPNLKIICLDMTLQYAKHFRTQGNNLWEIDYNQISSICNAVKNKENDATAQGGSVESYDAQMKIAIEEFIDSPDSKLCVYDIGIIGPTCQTRDNFYLRNGVKVGTRLLTSSEEAEIICKHLISKLKTNDNSSRCLLIFEEAHTLVPEGFSKKEHPEYHAAQQTSRYIMQGRKYGLGCFLISQRTATVTKSILSQCNSHIAFRAFDNTTIDFYSSIFGELAKSIPTLPDRQAIMFGDGFGLKRPVFVRVKDHEENMVS
ncbi:DUF87 domain-containing protein [bacterium]|nr:DUF87 domain-containing protein [bacterium]